MTPLANFGLAECDFGDQRLTKRAILIGEALSLKYGQPLSQVFRNASDLKRAYEFLTNAKTSFRVWSNVVGGRKKRSPPPTLESAKH